MWERHKIHWRACKLVRIDLKYVSHPNKFIAKVSHITTVLSTWKWFSLLLTHGLALLCAFPKLISISWIQFTAWSLTWAHICSKNKLLFEQKKESTFLRFHKHANSKVQKPPSQLRFSLPSIIITITSNEPWNTETTKGIKIHQAQITHHDVLNPLK